MNNDDIECLCGIKFDKNIFKNHFKKCEPLLSKFSNFDRKLSLLLKEYSFNKQSLIILKFLFKKYIKLFDKKIEKINLQNNNKITFIEENIEKPVKNKKENNNKEILNKNIIFNENTKNIILEKTNLTPKNNKIFSDKIKQSICEIIKDYGYEKGFFCKIKYLNKEIYCLITTDSTITQNKDFLEIKINNEIKKISLNLFRGIWNNEKLGFTCIEIIEEDNIINKIIPFELEENC